MASGRRSRSQRHTVTGFETLPGPPPLACLPAPLPAALRSATPHISSALTPSIFNRGKLHQKGEGGEQASSDRGRDQVRPMYSEMGQKQLEKQCQAQFPPDSMPKLSALCSCTQSPFPDHTTVQFTTEVKAKGQGLQAHLNVLLEVGCSCVHLSITCL